MDGLLVLFCDVVFAKPFYPTGIDNFFVIVLCGLIADCRHCPSKPSLGLDIFLPLPA